MQSEGGALAGSGMDRDRGVMALQDPETDGEAQTRAGAHVLGREKGVKDLFLMLLGNTDAVVCDDEFHRCRGLPGLDRDLPFGPMNL